MDTNSTVSEFSTRDLTFLLDRVNRSRRLGLSIEPDSVFKDAAAAALSFRAAYLGSHALTDFVAPLDETVPGSVRIKSILSPTATTEKRGWNDDGMSTGGYSVVLWSLRPEADMTLTAEGRDSIPVDFEVEPCHASKGTQPRDPAWIIRHRIRQWTESQESLADALACGMEDDTVISRGQRPVGPGMR